jgi:hypothetical protein
MNTDELRTIIWDYLYQAQASRTFDEIAAFAQQELQTIGPVVDHEWFIVTDDRVRIAYATGAMNGRHAS